MERHKYIKQKPLRGKCCTNKGVTGAARKLRDMCLIACLFLPFDFLVAGTSMDSQHCEMYVLVCRYGEYGEAFAARLILCSRVLSPPHPATTPLLPPPTPEPLQTHAKINVLGMDVLLNLACLGGTQSRGLRATLERKTLRSDSLRRTSNACFKGGKTAVQRATA